MDNKVSVSEADPKICEEDEANITDHSESVRPSFTNCAVKAMGTTWRMGE